MLPLLFPLNQFYRRPFIGFSRYPLTMSKTSFSLTPSSRAVVLTTRLNSSGCSSRIFCIPIFIRSDAPEPGRDLMEKHVLFNSEINERLPRTRGPSMEILSIGKLGLGMGTTSIGCGVRLILLCSFAAGFSLNRFTRQEVEILFCLFIHGQSSIAKMEGSDLQLCGRSSISSLANGCLAEPKSLNSYLVSAEMLNYVVMSHILLQLNKVYISKQNKATYRNIILFTIRNKVISGKFYE
jgi:hypothetical protein